jgi:hypothetical protein
MSHKTEIKTELKNKRFLTKALESLGFTYTEAAEGQKLTTRGRYGVHEEVDILVNGNGNQNFDAAVGFKKNADGTYTAVGDFYGLRTASGKSVSADMLKCEVTSHAKEIEVNERLSALMFQMEEGTRKENDKEISFTLQRWVD